MQRHLAPGLTAGILVFCAPALRAQSAFATSVVDFQQGAGGGVFEQANVLGGPQGGGLGGGSLHVLTLGDGGRVTLGFDVAIVDGPGADLTVFENGFLIGGEQVFAEILFVEVSTDDATYARFPAKVGGSGTEMGAFRGLSGGLPVLANVVTNPIDPLDPVVSGGEAFDLADLAGHPDVLSGAVDLGAIHYVRLVDVLPGDVDSSGAPLPGSGGADVDAVAVLNADATASAGQPFCDLWIDDLERLHLVVGDPDGFFTLDLASARASIDLTPVPLHVLLSVFTLDSASPTELHLVTPPLAGAGFTAPLAVSVADLDGHRSADQAMVQNR
jgi:hypothetical protein